jgi:hypothetical protein
MRRWLLGCVALAVVGVGVWSAFQKLGWVAVGADTHLAVENGAAEVRHVYAVLPPVTEEQWRTDPAYRNGMPAPALPWWFDLTTEQILGRAGAGTVVPAKFWTLRLPLWAVVVALVGLWGWWAAPADDSGSPCDW